ncbi:phage portal protein [Microvirga sp. 2YAF29]|uniref:phage portal protein n=1 Tax=Microvirga sp. 2YAF29 TaxID=3233031 RepID=UPI003F998EA0
MFHWRRKKDDQQEEKNWTLSSSAGELLALFGGGPATASGVAVGGESALKVPAVACAVRSISEAIAQLPIITYKRGDNGSKERATDHPAYGLLHDDASDWQSAYDLKLQIQVDALIQGNGYGFVNKVGGKPREIIRLKPGTVSVQDDDGIPKYLLNEGKRGQRVIPLDQIIHIRGLSTDGITGKSAVRLAAEAIGIAAAQEGHAARLFGSGGRPSGVLKVPGKLSKETVGRLRASWEAQHAGGQSGKTAVLEEGMEFTAISFNSVDMQFLELRTFQIQEIARAFRVPPHMLMELGRATWSNSEEMGRLFLTFTLMPWIKQWEGAIRRAVFSKDERATYFAEYLTDDLARADLSKRAESYQKLIAARVINPNEARAAENRPPYDGGNEFINPNVTATPAAGNTPDEGTDEN